MTKEENRDLFRSSQSIGLKKAAAVLDDNTRAFEELFLSGRDASKKIDTAEVREFLAQHGHNCRVPREWGGAATLSQWIAEKPADRIKQLSSQLKSALEKRDGDKK